MAAVNLGDRFLCREALLGMLIPAAESKVGLTICKLVEQLSCLRKVKK